jgi:hypothetical protein
MSNGGQSPERGSEKIKIDDPLGFLFINENSKERILPDLDEHHRQSSEEFNIREEQEPKIINIKEGYLDYGYKIILTYENEDGLMENYLNGKILCNKEITNENEKPSEDPSDWFNFGFDEEKWIKFLNKSILVHYERHLIQQQANEMRNIPVGMNPMAGVIPVRPMGGYIPHYGMYRWPYPMMNTAFPNPSDENKNK